LHDFLAALDLHALTAVNDHVEADYVNASLLDRRTKELLIIVNWLRVLDTNWLRVLGTAERSQIHQGVRHQLHPVVPLLDTFKS
jgi:hypothetical protein